jgi:type VI secretion system secreted protein Hcp
MASLNGFINWGDIKGSSKDDKHKDWSEITSFSHGMEQSAAATRSQEGGAYDSEVDHKPFVVTKPLDKASAKLYEALHNGTVMPKVIVELTRPTGKAPLVYMRYTMENVALHSVNTAAGSNDDSVWPQESFGMTYTKLQWEFTLQDDTGSAQGTVATKVDLAKGAGAS